MSFIPASIISFIVRERETKVKHQQLVSGVSHLAYWSSNFFMDFTKQLIPSIVCSALVYAFQIEALISNDQYGNNYGAVWAFFIL
jgi:ATP-binding cassette subfamily A (ABC1) protein 3